MRTFLIALLATAALPAVASAQEPDGQVNGRLSLDTEGRTPIVAQTEARGGWRGGDRGARSAPTTDGAARPARNWGGEGQARPERRWGGDGPARPQRNWGGDGQARPQRNWNDDGGRSRRFDRVPTVQPAPAEVQVVPPVQSERRAQGNRDGNGDPRRVGSGRDEWPRDRDGRRDWDRNNDGRPDWNERGQGRRDWNRDDDGRRDWDRNKDGRPDWNRRSDGRRDWDRNDDGRRDWNGRRDWDRNGWNDNRRNFRQWDRGWRNNSRYDWQRYRSSNRYAYRLPRYAAPYGWNYGYRRQSIGAYLFAGLFARDYWISDPWAYRLPPVYWPYQWVRYYNDALLVDTRSGYVVDSIPDIFWY